MKKCISYAVAVFFLCTSMAYAVPMEFTITDEYIGGNYSSFAKKGGDVIALDERIDYFDIDSMIVLINSNGEIIVTIQTEYTSPNDQDDDYSHITYGDLFISTDGWDPYDDLKDDNTESLYNADTKYNGQDWDYVLNTDSKNIYSINDSRNNSKVLTSNNVMTDPDSWYRTHQEVLYAPDDEDVSLGSFVFSQGGSNEDDTPLPFISYGFNLSALGIDLEKDGLDLGFHWTMTCANDVIEGGVSLAPVPEPGTMLLLGFGLLGLGAVGRKHYPQK